MKIYCLKTAEGFYPAHASDKESFDRLKSGEIYSLSVVKPRNYKFHKKFFALVKVGFEAQHSFDSMEWYREWLLMKAGHFEKCKSPKGTDLYRAKSISFDNMDELEFERLFKDVQNTIIRVHKITREQIEENLTLFL